jgi:hypothetical protein
MQVPVATSIGTDARRAALAAALGTDAGLKANDPIQVSS